MGLVDPRLAEWNFYTRAVAVIAATAPDVVGLTSMALESHLCLEIARRLKRQDPGVRVVLGGRHFSAIAGQVVGLYPWVDFVVTGEGELAARALLRHLRRGRAGRDALANVAYLRGGERVLDRHFKPHASLDELPFPAYHLVDLESYFRLNPYRVLDIEHARGCALRCAFCYSPIQWGQGEQHRRIDRILADVERHHALGARHLFFVGDNFVHSKPFARRLAEALAGANPGLTWRCYATLAQLTEELVESLARAECKYVFIGVDAVSEHAKTRFGKRYFRGWPRLRTSLERMLARGMTPTCAFMLNPGDPGETEAALEAAVHTYNLGAGVRLNPLTVYAGTALEGAAGEPLWPVIDGAAAAVDHATSEPQHWGALEAEAFFAALAGRHLPEAVRDTLAFEITEHRLRRSRGAARVQVEVEDTALDFDLHRHALLGLSRLPSDYETTERPPRAARPRAPTCWCPTGRRCAISSPTARPWP